MNDHLQAVLLQYFPKLDQDKFELLIEQFHQRDIAKGEMLFVEGDLADCLYFVIEGRFAVHKAIGIGKRTQAVALLDVGTVIGEGAFTPGRLRGATVLAVEDSKVFQLTGEVLATIEKNLPEQYIGLLKKIFSITSLRLQKSSERLALVL